MKNYIGVKSIKAEPMNLGDYNSFRGWEIPKDENPEREGYRVVYPDGYVSWSPKEVFEEAYKETDGLTFGLAVEAMKKGFKVKRKSWAGYWFIAEPGATYCGEIMNKGIGLAAQHEMNPTIIAKLKDNNGYTPATPYQEDMLAGDWEILD